MLWNYTLTPRVVISIMIPLSCLMFVLLREHFFRPPSIMLHAYELACETVFLSLSDWPNR